MIRIEEAGPQDARTIGAAVVEAIGMEITEDFAGADHTAAEVIDLFAELAAMEDSQYSYRNTLVARDEATGEIAGVIISYDGARLHQLRQRFFELAKLRLGKDMEGMTDETDAGEYYLDTLAVLPPYRRQGIATRLLNAAVERAHSAGKPAGLLVDKTNPSAERLYRSIGFRPVGERPFASVLMNHLQK